MSDNVLGRYDWRSSMDVPGGIPTGGYQPPNVLRQGPMPTGSERVSDWLQQYLPANVLGDRVRAVAAPVIASFGPDYYDMGQDVARGGNPGMLAASLIPGMRPATKAVQAAAGAGENVLVKGIRAYHGSPHDFDRFDLSKIGTGEGAQAYGHGLYFAENEGVARSYREGLSRMAPAIDGKAVLESHADGSLPQIIADKIGIPRSEGIGAANIMADSVRTGRPIGDILREKITREKSLYGSSTTEAWANKLEDISPNASPGRMYEVNIKANPEDFLDWDKPLSQQSEKVRQAFPPDLHAMPGARAHDVLAERVVPPLPADADSGWTSVVNTTNDRVMRRDMAARKLREAGIPGIKYLDQGSRTAGEGSRNYVVFDDAMVEILRKYGLLPPAAVGGAAMAGQSGEAQAMP